MEESMAFVHVGHSSQEKAMSEIKHDNECDNITPIKEVA